MNYLLNFANLLKFLLTSYPKPHAAVPAKNFAKAPLLDNSLMWMTQPTNSAAASEEIVQNQADKTALTVPSSSESPTVETELAESSPIVLDSINQPVDPEFVAAVITDENSIKSVEVAEMTTDETLVSPISIVQESELVAESETKSVELVEETPVMIAVTTPLIDNEAIPERPTGWITVHLKQQVTLANLNELQIELQQLLGKRVQLSGSQVQRVDTAALQLLLAFMHSPDVSVCWIDHSPALRQAAQLLGLSTLLSLPE
jgi:ABC-type transporter Mla MlaB component